MNRRKTIDGEAAHWVVELAAGDVSACLRAEFARWRATSHQHAQAHEEMEAVWHAADSLRDCPPFESLARNRNRRRGISAGIVTIVLVLLTLWRFHIGRDVLQEQEYATDVGVHRTVTLPDGSVIHLNTNSKVTVQITNRTRRIALPRGEALFEVAHEQNRPFEVMSANHTVRATGTEFSVRRREDRQLQVLVVSGKVVLDPTPEGTPEDPTHQIRSGELVEVSPSGAMRKTSLSPETVQRQLLWKKGLIFFDGESLETAIAEMNRYSPKQLRIESPAVRKLRIAGAFRVDDMDGFIHGISTSFRLRRDASNANQDEIRLIPDQPVR